MDMPVSKGRPRRDRVKAMISFDKEILEKIDALKVGSRSDSVNKLIAYAFTANAAS
jgi:hypothetical protein